jgi:KamA family protein
MNTTLHAAGRRTNVTRAHTSMRRNSTSPHFYGLKDLAELPQLKRLPDETRKAMDTVAHVLPFRANDYVVEELIDWSNIPDDPIFQLTFPQPGMLTPGDRARVERALERGDAVELNEAINAVRGELNPHPAGQQTLNVPEFEDEPVPGIQHKYEQTCLVFPSAGQTCHAYCTFCFRWAQFVGDQELRFATDKELSFVSYLEQHDEITDVLFTGGDPMIMKASVLERYLAPLLDAELEHVQTIRIGTKALGYWPYRFLTDDDAEDLLRLFERIVAAGKHLAVMAHFVHWKELDTPAVRAAIERVRATGAVIRTQAPLIQHVNDDADVWARMWKEQVRLGLVPYYMFVERDTGASEYFKVPLVRALDIYRRAMIEGSGLARTARGPTMSTLPGKVTVDGIAEIDGREVFSLSFLQARNPDWCKWPFFAELDPTATWLSDLRPAFGAREFFFEAELRELAAAA